MKIKIMNDKDEIGELVTKDIVLQKTKDTVVLAFLTSYDKLVTYKIVCDERCKDVDKIYQQINEYIKSDDFENDKFNIREFFDRAYVYIGERNNMQLTAHKRVISVKDLFYEKCIIFAPKPYKDIIFDSPELHGAQFIDSSDGSCVQILSEVLKTHSNESGIVKLLFFSSKQNIDSQIKEVSDQYKYVDVLDGFEEISSDLRNKLLNALPREKIQHYRKVLQRMTHKSDH